MKLVKSRIVRMKRISLIKSSPSAIVLPILLNLLKSVVNDSLVLLVTVFSIVIAAIIIVPLVYLFAPLAKYQARKLEQHHSVKEVEKSK